MPTVYAGTFIHASSQNSLSVREHTIVGVGKDGKIVAIASSEAGAKAENIDTHTGELKDTFIESVVKGWDWGKQTDSNWKLFRASKNEWFFPGFVDTHIHASQFPNAGIFGETTLLDWLKKYTFPLEASLADVSKADLVYSHCVHASLRNGTTTAAYYATIAVPSTNRLADICLEAGQRAFIGRCNMDNKGVNEEYYRDESSASAIEDTRATIAYIAHIDPRHHLVSPIITPRFAPSCTCTLLSALGDLASETSLPIQTHISENPDEVALVTSLFPDQDSYADVYDHHGLLTPRTVLAHAVHLTEAERVLISKRGTKVSHCPVSNSCLSSGLCPVRELLDAGIEVGLGTDVSGGWSPSVLVAAREAGTASRILAGVARDRPLSKDGDPSQVKLTVEECLYLATAGGASCLGLSDKVGRFELGMEWDAQLVNLGPPLDLKHPSHNKRYTIEYPYEPQTREEVEEVENRTFLLAAERGHGGPVQLWGTETWEEKLAKWVFSGDERNTTSVWVKGRLVHRREESFSAGISVPS